jgi:hypothetical protein
MGFLSWLWSNIKKGWSYYHLILSIPVFIFALWQSNNIEYLLTFIYGLNIKNIISLAKNSNVTVFGQNLDFQEPILQIISIIVIFITCFYLLDYLKRKGLWIYVDSKYEKYFSSLLYLPSIFVIFILPLLAVSAITYYTKNQISIFNFGTALEVIVIIISILIFFVYKEVSGFFNSVVINYGYLKELAYPTDSVENNYKNIKFDIWLNNKKTWIGDYISRIRSGSDLDIKKFQLIYWINRSNFSLWALNIDLMVLCLLVGIIMNFNIISIIFVEACLLSWYILISSIRVIPNKISDIYYSSDNKCREELVFIYDLGGYYHCVKEKSITLVNKSELIKIVNYDEWPQER